MLRIGLLLSAGLVILVGAVASTSGSPTGRLAVAATRTTWRDGSPVESGGLNYPTDIYVVDVNGRRLRNITRDERTEYSWSWLPDGRRILFASVPSDRMKPGPSHLFVINADGTNRQLLTSGTGELSPELAPDGRSILFVAQGVRQRGLYVMQTDGTRTKRLTRSRERPYEASWSPDGRRIVFVREVPPRNRSDIYVINGDGTGLHRLTPTHAAESAPAWSPDGREIAFVREVGLWDLVYAMRFDGTNVKRLTSSGHNRSPAWLSNDRLAYFNADDARMWSITANGTGKRRALPQRIRLDNHLLDRRGNDLGALSPDGSWIAFVTSGHRIWVARADGTRRQLVTRKICCFGLSIQWAPK